MDRKQGLTSQFMARELFRWLRKNRHGGVAFIGSSETSESAFKKGNKSGKCERYHGVSARDWW